MILFEHAVPTLFLVGGVALAVLLCVLTHLKFVTARWAALPLLVLRLLFFGLLTWCLLLPGRRTAETRVVRPRFVIALDASASMRLAPTASDPTRWDAATAALRIPAWSRVAAACELDVYPFATEVGAARRIEDALQVLPEGRATLLRDSLVHITRRYTGQNVAGMVLLSDGLDTRERDEEWTTTAWPFPIYTLRLEPETAWEQEPDVRIDSVQTPRRVNVGWKTELTAVLSGEGTANQAQAVELFRNGEKIDEVPIQLPAGGGTRKAVFELEHPRKGSFTFRVYVPPLEGESNTDDNAYEVSVLVVDADNRLLYVEGVPRWESKYLSRTLRGDDQVDALGFIQGPGGQFMHFGTRGSMTTEMRQDQLAFFKIVILGNLDAAALDERQVDNLIEFVRTGGSLICLGGTKAWGPDGVIKTDLRTILPVTSWSTTIREGTFPVELTDAGRSHPAFAATDPGLWEVLPPVLSLFPDAVLSPAAQSLVVARTPEGPEPIIASQRYGQGKVAVTLTDSLWKWVLNEATLEYKPYARFWSQLLGWAIPEKEELDRRRLDLWADREQLALGETLEIKARKTKAAQAAAPDAEVTCEITTADDRTLAFTMQPREVATPSGGSFPGFATEFEARQPGIHRMIAVMQVAGRRVESDPYSFFVKPFTPESVPRAANTAVLKQLAAQSGGAYFDRLDGLDQRLSTLDFEPSEQEQREFHSLWEYWSVIGLLIALLAIEWLLRKLRNMP